MFDPESRHVTMAFGHDLMTPEERVRQEEKATTDRLSGAEELVLGLPDDAQYARFDLHARARHDVGRGHDHHALLQRRHHGRDWGGLHHGRADQIPARLAAAARRD